MNLHGILIQAHNSALIMAYDTFENLLNYKWLLTLINNKVIIGDYI